MKNSIALTISLLIAQTCIATDTAQLVQNDENKTTAIATPAAYSPNNTVFLIDFHHVMANFSPKQAMSIFWNAHHKKHILSRLFSYSMKKYLYTNGFTDPKESVLEFYLNNDETSPETIRANNDLVNAFTIDQKTIELLQRLKDLDYKLVLFSNMPDTTLLIQQQRNPAVFNLFDRMWVRTAANNYASKGNSNAYEQVKLIAAHALGHTPEHYIFLDDNRHNITVATNAEIIGILFSSAAQAERKLKQMAIL